MPYRTRFSKNFKNYLNKKGNFVGIYFLYILEEYSSRIIMSLFSQISGINANSIKQFSGITDDIEKEDKFDYSDVDFTVGDNDINEIDTNKYGKEFDDSLFDYNKNEQNDISDHFGFNFEG